MLSCQKKRKKLLKKQDKLVIYLIYKNKGMNKKIMIIVGVLFYILSTTVSYAVFSKSSLSKPDKNDIKYTAPKNGNGLIEENNEPKTEECPLNGEMLTKEQRAKWEKRRPLGIMVENHEEARPQSGLSSADIIYEAVAEGGITRFLTIFYCKDAPIVGPVRSARMYFLNLLEEYGEYPLYAHVGGAHCDEETGSGCANGAKADALGRIRKLGWYAYNDMDQFGVPFPYYWRDYERLPNRATEHTVYTSTSKLWDYASTKRGLSNVDEDGIAWNKDYKGRVFIDGKPSNNPKASKISLSFWDNREKYNVSWVYDKTSNTYKRINGKEDHLDKNTGKVLSPYNVVVLFMDESPANDGYEGGHLVYGVIGGGKALVFQNGDVIQGTWEKDSTTDRLIVLDNKNQEIPFVRGQIFYEIIPTGNSVDY